jgi:hypothetical protein
VSDGAAGEAVAVIYVLQTGALTNDGVEYTNVVGFTTRRQAETILRRVQREDPYMHQYDRVEAVSVYRTEGAWKRGVKVAARWQRNAVKK